MRRRRAGRCRSVRRQHPPCADAAGPHCSPAPSRTDVDHFPAGHEPTDYRRWASAAAPYPVRYAELYEPYVVVRKDAVPRYDERFVGYGMNKIAHILACHARGLAFHVVPSLFVAAPTHPKSTDWERTYGKAKVRAAPNSPPPVQTESLTLPRNAWAAQDPLRKLEVQALFTRFKHDLGRAADAAPPV